MCRLKERPGGRQRWRTNLHLIPVRTLRQRVAVFWSKFTCSFIECGRVRINNLLRWSGARNKDGVGMCGFNYAVVAFTPLWCAIIGGQEICFFLVPRTLTIFFSCYLRYMLETAKFAAKGKRAAAASEFWTVHRCSHRRRLKEAIDR